jgi:hypothetical protein
MVQFTHSVPSARRYCMDAHARWRDDAPMPVDLTDEELTTAATACRTIAYQEGEAREKDGEPHDARPGRERCEALCRSGGEVRGSAPRRLTLDTARRRRPLDRLRQRHAVPQAYLGGASLFPSA